MPKADTPAIVWEEPPRAKGGPSAYESYRQDLRARPRKWGRVPGLTRQAFYASRETWAGFEMVQRDGIVYIRYVGKGAR